MTLRHRGSELLRAAFNIGKRLGRDLGRARRAVVFHADGPRPPSEGGVNWTIGIRFVEREICIDLHPSFV